MPALPHAQNDVTAADVRVYVQSEGGELHQETQETQPAQLQVHVSYFSHCCTNSVHFRHASIFTPRSAFISDASL